MAAPVLGTSRPLEHAGFDHAIEQPGQIVLGQQQPGLQVAGTHRATALDLEQHVVPFEAREILGLQRGLDAGQHEVLLDLEVEHQVRCACAKAVQTRMEGFDRDMVEARIAYRCICIDLDSE